MELINVNMDSEPELDIDDSSREDNQPDAYGLEVYPDVLSLTQHHMSHSALWLGTEGLKLHYEANVDAVLQFDPLDTRKPEKLKL